MITERRRLTMHRLSCLLVLLMLVVIGVSAWLRLAAPRAVCDSWPLCRITSDPTAGMYAAATTEQLRPVRAVHRAAATLALVVVLALLAVALVPRPRDWQAARTASMLLALALGLSVLGIATAGSRALPVVFGNLFGGYAMLAMAFSMTRQRPVEDAQAAQALARRARLGVLLWVMQIALGATSGGGTASPAGIVHLGMAIIATGWAYRVGRRACGVGLRVEGRLLMALSLAQWLLGGAAAWSGAPATMVVAHSVSAACGLAVLVSLQWRLA